LKNPPFIFSDAESNRVPQGFFCARHDRYSAASLDGRAST
jgi:hypothetical protein